MVKKLLFILNCLQAMSLMTAEKQQKPIAKFRARLQISSSDLIVAYTYTNSHFYAFLEG
jgi:hypothetical protein